MVRLDNIKPFMSCCLVVWWQTIVEESLDCCCLRVCIRDETDQTTYSDVSFVVLLVNDLALMDVA